jgi:hypothetical protein
MTKAELREKIRALAFTVIGEKLKADDASQAYDELTKFPELKDIIVNLMTHEFDSFLERIDWVSPKPSTFRIVLLNGESFLLTYGTRSWVATVAGKKYYLLNLDEEEYASQAISRILQYGPKSGAEVTEDNEDSLETEDPSNIEDEDIDTDVEA